MTIKELINALSKYDENMNVVYEHPEGELYIDNIYIHGNELVLGTN